MHFKCPPICPELERHCLNILTIFLSIVVMPWIIQSICLSIVRGTRDRRSMFLSIFQSGTVRGSSAIVFFEYVLSITQNPDVQKSMFWLFFDYLLTIFWRCVPKNIFPRVSNWQKSEKKYSGPVFLHRRSAGDASPYNCYAWRSSHCPGGCEHRPRGSSLKGARSDLWRSPPTLTRPHRHRCFGSGTVHRVVNACLLRYLVTCGSKSPCKICRL